jgi:hypothetical protein
MNNYSTETKENVLAGAVGAFLFSLVGGILWFVLYQIGYVAALSGLIGVICAVKGYTFFAKTKNESNKCLVISVIIAIAVLVLAWYLCVGYDIYLAYQAWYEEGEVDFTLTFFESVRVIPYFFFEGGYLVAYLKDLGFGMLFAILGVISYLSSREKKRKRLAEEAAVAERVAKEAELAQETEATEFAGDAE